MIRFATQLDIPFIVKEGVKFLKYHPANIDKDIDTEHLLKLADELIENHVLFVAEENGELVGMIAGFLSSNIFNPKYVVLQELFWWVVEEKRSSTVAFKLYDAFESHAKEIGVSVINMVSTVYTPTLQKWYKKKGYIPVESSFIKEL